MKKIFLTILLAGLLSTPVQAGEPLGKIVPEKDGEKITLDPSLEKYIKTHLPKYHIVTMEDKKNNPDWQGSFVAPHKLPRAMVLGDFNGDKNQDIALLLVAEDHSDTIHPAVFIFHNLGNGKFDYFHLAFAADGIKFKNPGREEVMGEKEGSPNKYVTYKTPALDCYESEASSWFYYWKDGKYKEEWTGD